MLHHLFIAIKENRLIDVKDILKKLPNLLFEKNIKNDLTPLLFAIIKQKTEIIKLLIKEKPDIYVVCNKGRSALTLAVLTGNILIVELIIRIGVPIDNKDNLQRTALMWAAQKGFIPILNLLLKNNADINACDNEGNTALLIATYFERELCVRCLLKNKPNINHSNKFGLTALMIAATVGNLTILRFLIEDKASTLKTDDEGNSALFWAVKFNHLDCVDELITSKPLIDLANHQQKTPLEYAASQGFTRIVNSLLDAGANINRKSCNEEFISDSLAKEAGHYNIIKILYAERKLQDLNISTIKIKKEISEYVNKPNEKVQSYSEVMNNILKPYVPVNNCTFDLIKNVELRMGDFDSFSDLKKGFNHTEILTQYGHFIKTPSPTQCINFYSESNVKLLAK
ncbi:MAG: hypothetical protein JWM09_204 [Francisellaceae bacterium]|nr:hypothetical protein [Francisellaceae bacterium]